MSIQTAGDFTAEQVDRAGSLGLTYDQCNEQLANGLTVEQIFLLKEWSNAKDEAAKWKVRELELRAQVAHCGITTQAEGTNRQAIGGGLDLKTVIKINYRLDNDVRKVQATLAKLPDHIADRLVKWVPNFYPGEYKKLVEDEAMAKYVAVVNEVLTTDEATPTVEIAPASKRK